MSKIKPKVTWPQLHKYTVEIIEIGKGAVDHYGKYLELLVKLCKDLGINIVEASDAKD